MTATLQILSDTFGVDIRTIQNWADKYIREGNQVRINNVKGQYDFILFTKCRHQEILTELDKIRRDKPQDALALKNTELKELQLQRELKKLIDADEVARAWTDEIQIIIANVDGIYPKMALMLDETQKIKLREVTNKTKEKIAGTTLDIQTDI